MTRPLALVAVLSLFGCGDDDGAAPTDAGADAGRTADATTPDAGPPDAGAAPDVCDEMGLPRVPMQPSTGHGYGDVAGDFTVETIAGPFTLSERWSGCESYVFVNYASSGVGDALWASFPDPIFARSARNTHYFFTSYESDRDAVARRMAPLRDSFEIAFAALPPEDAEHWRERVHFVLDPLLNIDGSPGERARNQPGIHVAFAIDRAQRFDEVGSLMEITSSGFVPRLGMAAWVSHYYNYRATLADRLASETDVTVVPLVSETDWTERVFDRSVDLPDAATMAGFDTLALDVEVICRREPRNCSEWDRIAKIELCVDATCDDRRELVRWITPYSRPGSRRWIMDASPMLGLMSAGGPTAFRITMGPTWEVATERDVQISIRLADRGGDAPVGADLAFTGGPFDDTYNPSHVPFRFTPPAGTTRVELVAIISGHGQTPGDNCAEWCNHEHALTVNGGTTHRVDYADMAGRPTGCAERASDGVIPGQYGNWAPLRAGWCPGLPVDAVTFDVTADVDLGMENVLTYVAQFAGAEPRGGTIDLSAFVVYY